MQDIWDYGRRWRELLRLPMKRWHGNIFGAIMEHDIGYKIPKTLLIDDVDQMIIMNDVVFGVTWPFPEICNVWHMNESSARIV